MDATYSIILGLLILVVAFLLRRAGTRSRRGRETNAAEDVRREFLAAEREGRSQLEKLELRLYEFAREVDALSQTRIATLKELIAAADCVLCELDARVDAKPPRELGADHLQMIALLADAGYDAKSIAALIDGPAESVRQLLAGNDDVADAA